MVSITRLNLLGDMGQGQPAHAFMKKLFATREAHASLFIMVPLIVGHTVKLISVEASLSIFLSWLTSGRCDE